MLSFCVDYFLVNRKCVQGGQHAAVVKGDASSPGSIPSTSRKNGGWPPLLGYISHQMKLDRNECRIQMAAIVLLSCV